MRSNLLLKRSMIIGSVTADGLALTVSQQSSLLFSSCEICTSAIYNAPNMFAAGLIEILISDC